jgi:hypothetical protein
MFVHIGRFTTSGRLWRFVVWRSDVLDHARRRPPAATDPTTPIPQHERERQHEHDYARVRSDTRGRSVRMSTGNFLTI